MPTLYVVLEVTEPQQIYPERTQHAAWRAEIRFYAVLRQWVLVHSECPR